MGERRQFEVLLLRLVPHALRDDFMTVGVVVLEDSRQPSAVSHQVEGASTSAGEKQADQGPRPSSAGSENSGLGGQECPPHTGTGGRKFADVRFTRDWKRVECFAPDFEIEILERLEAEVRGRLKEIRSHGDLLKLLEDGFGPVFDVGPVKALMAEDPVAEMRVLERDYLAPMERVERARRLGRLGIVSRMEAGFADAGVLELMQRDIEMSEFTGKEDPFRVDFGFRVGTALKMFHGLALNLSREPAVTLAYRYARIRSGMRGRGEEALMTAIVSEEAMRRRGEVASGIAMLRANEVEVRGVEEMGEIAERVRREISEVRG